MTSDSTEINDDTKLMMARAFDWAWERFIANEGAAAETDDNRKRLALHIVEAAKRGGQNETQLAEGGLIHLSVLAAARRLSAAPPAPPRDANEAGDDATGASSAAIRAFGPDSVPAMSEALELCLAELPLRIPSDVVPFLTKAILEEASRGEEDPGRLSQAALAALSSR
jgi:hypothetical protein